MELEELMKSLMEKENVEKISKETEPDKFKNLIELGLPTLMGALGKNATSKDGAASLLSALKEHGNDDVKGMIQDPSKIDKSEGEKILKHILGSKDKEIKSNLAKESGLGINQVNDILAIVAPLLMGILGNQQKKKGAGLGELTSMLSQVLGSNDKFGMMGIASKYLDQDSDSNLKDDIGGILGGMFKK